MRPNKRKVFMDVALAVSQRATCDRLHVGAVLVKGDHIIATGYNGAPSNLPQCDEVGHDIVNYHCTRSNHAEENLITQSAYHGVSTKGTTCYSTVHPCPQCVRLLYSSGVKQVIYRDSYENMTDDDFKRIMSFVKEGFEISQIDFGGRFVYA